MGALKNRRSWNCNGRLEGTEDILLEAESQISCLWNNLCPHVAFSVFLCGFLFLSVLVED